MFRKKSLTKIRQNLQLDSPLKRTLSGLDLVLLGIGAIVGAGLFSITGIAAAENAGPAVMLSFAIAAVACAFAGLCYSELATLIPLSGSAYTYAYVAMGEVIAWLIGWNLVLEYAIGAATVSISWSGYFVSLLKDFGIELPAAISASPWQSVKLASGELAFGYINLPAFLIVAFISWILILGIQQSARINACVVAIKLLVVVMFIALGFFYVRAENFHPFLPPNTGTFGEFGWSGVFRAAGIVFFAFIGFDAVSTAVQETKEPQKSIPLGILGSLIVCTILYIAFSFVLTGLVPYKDLNVAAPVAVAVDNTPFWWLKGLIKLGILAGLTSVILVLLLGQSRIFYSMSSDGLLPPVFSDIHPRLHTPWRCNLVLMVFVGLFGAFAPIDLVGEMTSIGTLFAFLIVCLGVLILRHREPDAPRDFRTPFVPYVPIAGALVCLFLMLSLNIGTWIRLVTWLFLGILIYSFYGRHHTHRHRSSFD